MNDSSPDEDLRPPLPPPRFGLKFMFLMLTAIAMMLASYHYWSGLGVAGVALVFSVVGAHFFGSSLGVQLQHFGSTRPKSQGKSAPQVAVSFARTTSLSHRRTRDFPVRRSAAVVGAAFAAAGGFIFSLAYGARISWIAIAAGSTAFFVLGTIAGFVVIAFVIEAIHAMNDATKDE